MKCPKCAATRLEADTVGGEWNRGPSSPYRAGSSHDQLRARVLDRCPSCGGVWFDRGEMARGLEEVVAVFGQQPVVPAPDRRPVVVAGQSGFLCPRCTTEMQTVQSGAVPEVTYEMCPDCLGVWFDKSELSKFARADAPERALLLKEFP